jgi:methylthioribose-1-phosphate isomerase
VKAFDSLALRFDGHRVRVLDQTQLPDAEVWLDGTDPDAMVGHIQRLSVRGAPLIGVAAAVSLGSLAERGARASAVRAAALRLRAARPTAANLMAAIDRLLARSLPRYEAAAVVDEVERIFDEDVALCEAMAAHGAPLIAEGEHILTHCNTGGLATAGIGTALGVIRRAHESGKHVHIYVDETRPLLQGARLTTWELRALGIPHTLITDGMAAILMRDQRVQRVLVGADRIARSGDFANKVGTYGVAVSAHHHDVPFHAVAPWTTVDLACPDGLHIPIEQRRPEEVRGARGRFGTVRWAPADTPVYNPAFDVTPVALVTSLILDRGVIARDDLSSGGLGRVAAPADLHALDNRRDALAAADAESNERSGQVAPLELVERGAEQDGAGSAKRMTERDGAAVDVDP